MSASEREKGKRAEAEVAELFRSFGVPADRTVHNSGVFLRGDLTGVEGYHVEVKRHETLRLPTWLRQAADEAPDEAVPIVAFRQNRSEWYAALPLRDLARLVSGGATERPTGALYRSLSAPPEPYADIPGAGQRGC